MNTDADRIKLAEAMGWEFHEGRIDDRYWCLSSVDAGYPDKYHSKWAKAPGEDWACQLCGCGEELPDPFTDANDDYAVLEHFGKRGENDPQEWERFKDYWREYRGEWNVWNYAVGDYARAALKVLETV